VAVTPLMLLPAATWLDENLGRLSRACKAALGALGTVSLGVQAAGCAFFWDFYIRMALALRGAQDEGLIYISTVFVPQLSPIVMHTWLAWHKILGDKKFPAQPPFWTVIDKYPSLENHWSGLRFDFWYPQWFVRGVSPIWGAALVTILGAGFLWSAVGLVRGARGPEARLALAPERRASRGS